MEHEGEGAGPPSHCSLTAQLLGGPGAFPGATPQPSDIPCSSQLPPAKPGREEPRGHPGGQQGSGEASRNLPCLGMPRLKPGPLHSGWPLNSQAQPVWLLPPPSGPLFPPALTCSTPDTWVSSRTPSSSWPQAVPSARTALPQVLGIAGSFSCLRSQLQGSSEVTRSGRGHRVCQVRNLRPSSPPPSEESDLERGERSTL